MFMLNLIFFSVKYIFDKNAILSYRVFSDAPYYVRGVSISQDVCLCVRLCTSLSFWKDKYLSKPLQMDLD